MTKWQVNSLDLTKFDFKTDYNKASDDIAAEFYLPCMQNSTKYDRISGYFGSTIYIIAWSAIKEFIANSGKMRIIAPLQWKVIESSKRRI